MLVVLLGMVGMVIDVGYAYYTQRSLQSSADAAALAGAQELPDSAKAISTATAYSGSTGNKNARVNVKNVKTTVRTRCLASSPGCRPVNAVTVDETAGVKTAFLGLFGFGALDVHIKSTACSPCSAKPLDIMLVLDRTGSMCQDHNGNSDPACTDLNNARNGIKTFLGFMDSSRQWVGLDVLPPATSVSNRCSTPTEANYNSGSAAYTIVPLSKDYSGAKGALNSSSDLVQTLNCQKANGRTSYATAIEKAQDELDLHGRADIPDIIIFLSDGAANIGPTFYSTKSPYRMQPCHQGVTSAAGVKSRGTVIYSIGYDLDAVNGGANTCTDYLGNNEKPAITAYQAIQQIASDPKKFYNKPDPGQLNTIFSDIAADVAAGASKLIDNDTP
jgi:hypothetical protein